MNEQVDAPNPGAASAMLRELLPFFSRHFRELLTDPQENQ